MKAKLFLSSLLIALTMTACGPTTSESSDVVTSDNATSEKLEVNTKVLSPSGAPAIAFYDQGTNPDFETNGNIENIKAKFVTDDYGMIVMDFFGGLMYNVQNKGNYKLAKILTGGNLYLVGIGEENKGLPKEGDYVVSFGQNSLPSLVYENLYPNVVATTHYMSSVKDVNPVLLTGKHAGNTVDYVVTAQPALFACQNNKDAATFGKLNVVASLRDAWQEKTGQKAIPQAGLFVNAKQYEANKTYYEEQFALVQERLDTAISDVKTVKATMDKQIPNMDDQKAKFGFNSAIALKVQNSAETPNGFALVSSEEEPSIDINAFLESVGRKNEAFANYIL